MYVVSKILTPSGMKHGKIEVIMTRGTALPPTTSRHLSTQPRNHFLEGVLERE